MTDSILLGTRKGLLLIERQHGRWSIQREVFPGIPVSYACCDPRTGTAWAALDHGHWGAKLHRSTSLGGDWQEMQAPKYPEGEVIYRPLDDAETKPAATSYIWMIQPGGKDQSGRMYIGTEPGGIFQSDDGGESFHLVESFWNHHSRAKNWFGGGRDYAGACSIIVDPRDSQHLYIGVSVGGVFESTDGGATWDGRNKGLLACYLPDPSAEYGHDPHFMLASPSNPDILWQQNHCGVFRSVDRGQNWQHISQEGGPAYFGFPIAVDAEDAEIAWVVPAVDSEYRIPVDRALRVARTDDGGKTWHDFRAGLPQEHCYDIVFRHALDNSGDRLAFGTTSGNVYLSDNRGESWQCIAQNLATVYSVRFV